MDPLALAEDPIYSTYIYLHKYFHIFIYFISWDTAILMLYLVDLYRKFAFSHVGLGTSIWRRICGMWNLNVTECTSLFEFWTHSTVHLSSPPSPPIHLVHSFQHAKRHNMRATTMMGAVCWRPHLPYKIKLLFFSLSSVHFWFQTVQHPSAPWPHWLLPPPTTAPNILINMASTTVTTATSPSYWPHHYGAQC